MRPETLNNVRARKPKAPRRVKLVATALAIISLSALGLFAVSLFPNALVALSDIVTDHPGYIRATNALMSAICAVFLLWPRAGSRLVGRWNEYVGWAFFILFIQYAIRLAALFSGAVVQPEWESAIKFAADLFIYPASFLNNILFLMAARILLNKSKGLRDIHPATGGGVLAHMKYYVAALRAGLPKWVWWMFLFTLFALLDNDIVGSRFPDYIVWARFPDAFFSIFCLSWFGYAVLLSLQVRRRSVLGWASFILVLSYGAGQLIYAMNPVIAYTLRDRPASQSRPVRWLKDTLWPNVDTALFQNFKPSDFKDPDKLLKRLTQPQPGDNVAIDLHTTPKTHPFQKGPGGEWIPQFTLRQKQEALEEELNMWLREPLYSQTWADEIKLRDETRALLDEGPATDPASVKNPRQRRLNRMLLEDAFNPDIKMMAMKDFLDGAIFALLFPMKYLLFMPAFVLYLLSLVSLNNFRRALHRTTKIRKDYLSEDGILQVIGASLDADEMRLLIRLPGVLRRDGSKEERCLAVSWSATKKHARRVERKIFAITKLNLLKRVMQTEGKQIILTNEDEGEEAGELKARSPLPQTLVLIPIGFHGGVIGVLQAVFTGYGKFNDGTLEQLKFMAELIAPSVQDFRTMSAVDKFGTRLNRGKFEDPSPSEKSDGEPKDAGDFDTAMDQLMSMLFDLLNPLGVGLLIECGFKTSWPAYPRGGAYYNILQAHSRDYAPKLPSHFETEKKPISVLEDNLPSIARQGEQLGKLMLIVPQNKDEFNQPTLAAHYLTRRMTASLVTNGIVNAARTSLAIVIHDLGLALNKETLSYEQWFTEVSAAARNGGLLWVVASCIGPQEIVGRLEYAEIVKELTPEENDDPMLGPIRCIPHKDPSSATRHIIHLTLDDGRGIWLGVARERFGSELRFNSPWREFLEKFAGIANAALKSIDERLTKDAERQCEEEARLQTAKEAAERDWVEKNNLIGVLTFHDLINLVRVQRDTAKATLEAANNGIEASKEQILESIKIILNSTESTRRLIAVISELTRWDGPLQCSISDAVNQAKDLVQHHLDQKRIKVEHHDDQKAVACFPQYVGALVIANLLRNAADASNEDGTITIHTGVDTGVVSCTALNNGKPVPEDVRKKLGELPLMHTEEHNGWGLFVIPRLLQKFDGTFQLLYSNASETCFTLQLPAAKG